MGFFNNWPYSNLHNLNLDWIIKEMKSLRELSEKIWERVKPVDEDGAITAAQAYALALDAETQAESAGNKATVAQSLANTANQTANSAKTAATTANDNAVDALTNASRAQDTADDAATAATNALVTANNAQASATLTSNNLNAHVDNTSNPHAVTAAQVGALPIGGGTVTGKVIAAGGFTTDNEINVTGSSNSGKIRIWCDNEGGNLQLVSPNGVTYEIDAYNNNSIRLRGVPTSGSAHSVNFNCVEGKLYIDGKAVLVEE